MKNHNSPEQLCSLWQDQESASIPISADELRQAADTLTKRVSWRNLREYAAVAFVVAAFGFYFYEFHTVLLRLGCCLTIAGTLLLAFHLHRKGSATVMAPEMDSKSCVDFHRSELMRQRDLLLAVWKWYLLPLVPGMTLFLLGLLQSVLRQPASRAHLGLIFLWFAVITAFCAGVFILVGWLNQLAAKNIQRKIDALDAAKIEP